MFAKLLTLIAEAKKAAVGAVGVASLLVATDQLHGTALAVAQAVLAIGTVLGIYKAKNASAA